MLLLSTTRLRRRSQSTSMVRWTRLALKLSMHLVCTFPTCTSACTRSAPSPALPSTEGIESLQTDDTNRPPLSATFLGTSEASIIYAIFCASGERCSCIHLWRFYLGGAVQRGETIKWTGSIADVTMFLEAFCSDTM